MRIGMLDHWMLGGSRVVSAFGWMAGWIDDWIMYGSWTVEGRWTGNGGGSRGSLCLGEKSDLDGCRCRTTSLGDSRDAMRCATARHETKRHDATRT